MNGIVEVEIFGKKRALVFNNYARVEIAKHVDTDPLNILDAVQEMNERNHLLLLKVLVYAAHCGDCYRRQNVTDLSMEDIGEWLAEASEADLYDVFKAFLDAEGFNLPPDDLKKKKATRKPKKKPGTA